MKLMALFALTGAAAAAVGRIQSHSAAQPPLADPKPLPALAIFSHSQFVPGLYQLSVVDALQAKPISTCIVEPEQLVRLRHAAIQGCTHLVVENAADRATVQYDCPAQGWGRTSIRAMDANGFKIETQGISGREPFAQTFNAHRTGACREPTQR